MKILFVCNEYPPALHGGIGIVTQILARELVRRGHQISVVGVYPKNNALPAIQYDEGVFVKRIPSSGVRKIGWIVDRVHLYMTVKEINSGDVDVVEVPDYQGMAAGWPRMSIPVLVRVAGSSTYNSLELGRKPNSKVRLLEKMGIIRGDFFCAMSEYAARKTEQIFSLSQRIITPIYNPILLPANHSLGCKNPNRVIFSGTLVERKGVIPLIKAWKKVYARFPSAILQIFGKDGISPVHGSMREYLLSLLDDKEKGSVFFYNHVSQKELFSALAKARIAVFPSYSETFGNAPVEAMAHGCATIYTKRSCGPEIIEDGIDGLLVDPDNPKEIANAIMKLLADEQLARRLGEMGLRKVREKFSPEVIIPRNEAFYAECIGRFKQGENHRT